MIIQQVSSNWENVHAESEWTPNESVLDKFQVVWRIL